MFYTWKLNFVLFCFNDVFSTLNATPMDILNFHFQPNINVETTLGHRHWIDVILSMLFQRCFVNVETMSINIRRLNFHFQPNFNVETTLVHRRWTDVTNSIDVVSTLFCQRWNNVNKCASAQLSCSTKYQRWNNVDNVDDQRCFNVDSTLVCLLGGSISSFYERFLTK